MRNDDLQFVTNEAGEPTAVIVPIALWREIVSECDTAYLLKSEATRQRLAVVLQRTDRMPMDDAVMQLGL